MMIDTKQFRLGNLVLDKKTKDFYFIENISKNNISIRNKSSYDNKTVCLEEFELIKITNNFLFWNGAKVTQGDENDKSFFIEIEKFPLKYWNGDFYYLDGKESVIVEYLHQLQNLFFAIKCKEMFIRG